MLPRVAVWSGRGDGGLSGGSLFGGHNYYSYVSCDVGGGVNNQDLESFGIRVGYPTFDGENMSKKLNKQPTISRFFSSSGTASSSGGGNDNSDPLKGQKRALNVDPEVNCETCQ